MLNRLIEIHIANSIFNYTKAAFNIGYSSNYLNIRYIKVRVANYLNIYSLSMLINGYLYYLGRLFYYLILNSKL